MALVGEGEMWAKGRCGRRRDVGERDVAVRPICFATFAFLVCFFCWPRWYAQARQSQAVRILTVSTPYTTCDPPLATHRHTMLTPQSPQPAEDPLQKLQEVELLPDLFTFMQSLERGEIQAKDFDNNAGAIRLKVSSMRNYLQSVEGICETVEEREKQIVAIRNGNNEKVAFLRLFREQVLKRLEDPRE